MYWTLIQSMYSFQRTQSFQKAILLFSPAASGWWGHGKLSEFHEDGPLLQFFGYEMSSLVQSYAMWNTRIVDKAFCKSMGGSFGKSIACMEGKSISRVKCPFQKGQNASLSWWKWSSIINLPPSSWLIILPREWCLIRLVFVSATGRLSAQQWPWLDGPSWVEDPVAKIINSLHATKRWKCHLLG